MAKAQAAARVLPQRYDPAVPDDLLEEHPDNPRDGNIGLITTSIDENGFFGALLCQEKQHNGKHRILAGNHRSRAAVGRGLVKLPVIFVDVDDDVALDILLADNKASDDATYKEPQLLALLERINVQGIDRLKRTLWTREDMDELAANIAGLPEDEDDTDEDEDAERLAKTGATLGEPERKVERGDFWRLKGERGDDVEHILICLDVFTDWDRWAPYLRDHVRDVFVPYPNPLLPHSLRAVGKRLVMVHPDPYTCGHLLDRWCDHYGGRAVQKLRTPDSDD
jgi:ParB-like nuclease domain